VITLAGDGRIGTAHGAALTAHFVLPVGVSVAPDESIVVVDAGDNAIYRLRNGIVDRVAGASTRIHDTAGAVGGYRDGPALAASFDRPTAAIERNDGAILVADSGNHCIRLIANGMVSTYAGSTTAGSADGEKRAASFNNPDGLAFAPDGALLVADYGNGIRRIAPDGTVTTIPTTGKLLNGIAAARVQGHDVIAYTDRPAVHLIVDGKEQSVAFNTDRMPNNEGVPVFHAWGIAILNENTVAVTDVITNVIRLIRFPSLPYTDIPASEALSGTLHEDTDFHGGFRDGTQTQALYHAPRGIAVDEVGRLVIADSGNRRIRLLSGFSSEETALPDFSNFAVFPGAHNVVLIGQSITFNGVLWNDSVAHTAQETFAQAAATDGIKGPVRFEAIRIDGAGPSTMFDVADNYVVDRGSIDAIVFFFTRITFPTQKEMVAEANKLAKLNIKTILYFLPEEEQLSVGEHPYDACGCVPDTQIIEDERGFLETVEQEYREVGIQTETFVDALIANEELPDPPTLYDMADSHYTPAGQRLLGRTLAQTLLAHRAWLAARAPTFSYVDTQTQCPKLPVEPGGDVGLMDSLSTGRDTRKPIAAGDVVLAGDVINFAGWAFSKAQPELNRIVCPVVDGFTGLSVRGDEHLFRPDVFRALQAPNAKMSGFDLQLETRLLPPGPHTIGTAVILGDGKAYPIGKPVDVTVK
jgi:hypothetical protein